ncbi:hypothetical protein [Kitasatospora sp. NPDC085879]|uniref:hypothetical protein n=1 Tax=Kitasatospora sp. NPDC085879 TaxID=3154769 RepID=UPI003435F00B
MRAEVPAGADLRRALQAVPELRELDQQSTRRSAAFIADAICAGNPEMERARAGAIALEISETVTRLLDLAFQGEPYGEVIAQELRVITKRYLLPYVTP